MPLLMRVYHKLLAMANRARVLKICAGINNEKAFYDYFCPQHK